MDLLPTFSRTPRGFPSAASWVLSSDICLRPGFASARRLMLMGFYNMAISKQRVVFMVTTEAEALQEMARSQPGLLIATRQLEQGCGLALVEQARAVVHDIRTVLILEGPEDDLVAAGRSSADAVLCEVDCFGEGQPLVTMVRTLALGQQYRSSSVQDALQAAAEQRERWRDGAPDLSPRELTMVSLLLEGLGDREIAEKLDISYETARSRGKALRRKLGARTRAQAVAKALQLGLARPGGGVRRRGPSPGPSR